MRMSQGESEAGSAFAGGDGQFGRRLWHGDVGLLGDLLQKKRPMRFELGVAASAAGLGARLPRTRKAFTRLTTKETDTLKCAAAAWRE